MTACTSCLNVLGGQRRHPRGTVESFYPVLCPSPSCSLPPFLFPDSGTYKILFRKVALPPWATPRPCDMVASPRGGWSARCCGLEGDPHSGTPPPCGEPRPLRFVPGTWLPHPPLRSALCRGSWPTPLLHGGASPGCALVLRPRGGAASARRRGLRWRPRRARALPWCGLIPQLLVFASAWARCQPRMRCQDAAQRSRGAQDTAPHRSNGKISTRTSCQALHFP